MQAWTDLKRTPPFNEFFDVYYEEKLVLQAKLLSITAVGITMKLWGEFINEDNELLPHDTAELTIPHDQPFYWRSKVPGPLNSDKRDEGDAPPAPRQRPGRKPRVNDKTQA